MLAIPRILFFAIFFFFGAGLFHWLFQPLGLLVAGAGGTFAGALITTWFAMRVFEQASVLDVGLHWLDDSAAHLGIGIFLGVLAASAVTLLPVLVGAARMVPDTQNPGDWTKVLFVSVMLLMGAAGEEIAMRGFPFQVLAGRAGPVAAILITSVVFGAMHIPNEDSSLFGIANTIGFGIVFGYAMLRTGELWLPIGMHFGWNWVLPLVGVPLSGFKMGLTGYRLEWQVPALWSGGGYGPEGGLLATVAVLLLALAVYRLPVRQHVPLLLAAPRASKSETIL